MENLIVAIVLYVAIVAIAYRPQTAATDPVTAPIDYFPEVEETTEPESVVMPVQPAIAATALSPVTVAPVATAKPEPVQTFTMPTTDLSRLGVRDLYKLASKAGIKGYKKLSKGALIQALA